MLIHVFLLMKNPREWQNHKCTHFNIINIIWLPLCSPRCPGFYLPVAAEEESQDHFYIPAQEVTLVRCQLGKRARAQACKRKQELHQEIPVFLHRKQAPSDSEPAWGEQHAQPRLPRATSTSKGHQHFQGPPVPTATMLHWATTTAQGHQHRCVQAEEGAVPMLPSRPASLTLCSPCRAGGDVGNTAWKLPPICWC